MQKNLSGYGANMYKMEMIKNIVQIL